MSEIPHGAWEAFEAPHDDTTTTVIDPCPSCAEEHECARHVFPAAGTRVRVVDDIETREPGDDDCTPVMVRAGEEGEVQGYVVEWHDVHVALITQDGQDVWIDVDNLELVDTHVPGEVHLNPALGPNPMDKETP